MTENTAFYTSAGNKIHLSLYGFDHTDAPCVIYVHGFKGFKDWGFVPVTGKFFEALGLCFLTFNFSHNGIGEDMENFTEPHKFRDNTFSLELQETLEVIEAYHSGRIFRVKPEASIGLLGHSRGGGISLLAAQASEHVKAVCTWAAVSTFARYSEEVIQKWEADKVLPVVNSRTGQVMELGWQLHTDLMNHIGGKLNIERAVRDMHKPMMLVHGTGDPAVSIEDAEQISSWGSDFLKEKLILDGANHVFGAQHPFQTTNPVLDQVWQQSFAFFQQHLQ